MPMTIYKLHASTAGDSVANLDIQIDGTITALYMTGSVGGADGLNDGFQAEVSFLSTNTFSTNDARGSLMTIQSKLSLLTSGQANTAVNANISTLDIPVAAGERVHLHVEDIGTPTARGVHAYLYVLDKGTPRIPGRRR